MSLPGRSPELEDTFLRGLEGADDARLAALVREALAAGRPGLAGRLVGMLGADLDDDPAIERARRAARLLCIERPEVVAFPELEELLEELRQRRMARSRARHRRTLVEADPFSGSRGPRRRR